MKRFFCILSLTFFFTVFPASAMQETTDVNLQFQDTSLNEIQQASMAPSGRFFGILSDVQEEDNATEFQLVVKDESTGQSRVLIKDFHLHDWKWDSDTTLSVRRSCGTGCMWIYRFDVETGKMISDQEDEQYNCNALYASDDDPFTNGYPNCILTADENDEIE